MTNSPLASRSIAVKLMLPVMLTLLVSMLVGSLLLSNYIRHEMTSAYMTAVDNLSQSLQQEVKDSLERGQMRNFERLLHRQMDIKGVIDVSLYDRELRGNLSSSDPAIKGKPLAVGAAGDLRRLSKPRKRLEAARLRIFIPQMVTPDCLRCHPAWQHGEQGGMLVLTFDLAPLHHALRKQQVMLGFGCAGLLLGVLIIVYLLSRSVTQPVVRMTSAMTRLAAGDLSVDIPARERADELGRMAAAVQVFKQNAQDKRRLSEEQAEHQRRAEREKTALMSRLAADFETNIGGLIGGVATAVAQLEASARRMAGNAGQTKLKSDSVAQAAEKTSANVLTVASATEEMSSSVAEISRQVAQAAEVARQAVHKAARTDQMVASLANASNKIGEVVKLITDIAGQTKLLALNATIEAARAGEVGKGFAVVANEVKELAKQTTAATREIGDQIADIQGATDEAVTAIRDIGATIGEINDISSAIAAAVEEQGVVTLDIAQNTQQAATASLAVSSDIAVVAQAAEETGQTATLVLDAASGLSQKAQLLRHDVAKFLDTVRGS